jgi:hypothetical protein
VPVKQLPAASYAADCTALLELYALATRESTVHKVWPTSTQITACVMLWVLCCRHPILRDPLPPPPVNFVARMPTQSDVML